MGTTAFAQSVSYDYDKTADFSKLKTYAWVPGTNLRDELNHKRIVDAVDAQLVKKGLTQVDPSAHPDILVAYNAVFNTNLQVHGYATGAGYRFGPYRSGSARVEEVMMGNLIVVLVDGTTRSLLWRGIATREVDVKADPEKREQNINKAAEKLFKNYPAKS